MKTLLKLLTTGFLVCLTSTSGFAALVAQWVADDWSGETHPWVDRVGGNIATVASAANSPTKTPGAIVDRIAKSALVFDGIDDYFSVASTENPIVGMNQVTIVALFSTTRGASGIDGPHYWLYPGPLNGESPFNPNDWGLTYDAAGTAQAFFNVDISPSPAVSLIDGQRHTMILTWQDPSVLPGEGVARLYVDGILAGSRTVPDGGDGIVDNGFVIGSEAERLSRFFSGAIGELRFYDTIEDPVALHAEITESLKTYTYTGANFMVESGARFSGSDSVTATFTLNCGLVGGNGDCRSLPFADYAAAVTSFSFTASGSPDLTITSADALPGSFFRFQTDGRGEIVGSYSIAHESSLEGGSGARVTTSSEGGFTVARSGAVGGEGRVNYPPGIWRSSTTFGRGANTFQIEFVEIGDAGNAADSADGSANVGLQNLGAVGYDYQLAKHEISENMILSATAAGLSNVVAGAQGGDKPAANVSWLEAAMFVNWLNTSQGHQEAYNFDETGNFQLWSSAEAWQFNGENLYRHKDAHYFLPSADEWYKAAYYNPVTGSYHLYPTGSDTVPTPVASGTAPDTVVYGQAVATGPADITQAGGLSPYGIMALGGNVWEWEETAADFLNDDAGENPQLRGSSWEFTDIAHLQPIHGFGNRSKTIELVNVGFRVAAIAEPWVVTRTDDSGAGSLREAIASVSPGMTITFSPALNGGSILLGGTELLIDKDLTLDASALPNGITVSGANTSQVFVIASGANVTLDSLTIADGRSAGRGGAISCSGTLTVRNSTIQDNTAGDVGGAIFNTGSVALLNSTLTRNTADGSSGQSYGGAIFNFAELSLIHCTVAGNDAPVTGGGLRTQGGTITVENTIVAGNTSSVAGPDISNSGAGGAIFIARGGNLLGDNSTVTNEFPADGVLVGGGTFPVLAPLLAPLGDFGGSTATMPPLPGSPAIEGALGLAGTPAADQRGAARPSGPRPDLGAVEAVPFPTLPLIDTDNDGIDDRLESSYGLVVGNDDSAADSDGDGSPDAEELANMTDPNDPNDNFGILSFAKAAGFDPLTNMVFDVTLRTFPGLGYALETDDTLQSFQTLTNSAFTATNHAQTLEAILDPEANFIRATRD